MTDIDEELMYSLLKSFADDTRIMKGVSNVREASQLQGDLFNVYDWSESNNMEFNSLKFEIHRYGADEALKQLTNYLTNIGTIIDEKDSVKDLGIIMSNDGSFTEHVNHVVEKAKTQMSSILRNFKSRSLNHMLCLWKSIVIPRLYCSQLWTPTKRGDIQKLEMLQKTFTRKINGLSNLTYWDRLKRCGIFSLQRRRERYQIIYVWKILEELVLSLENVKRFSNFSDRGGRTCTVPSVNRNAPEKIQTLRESSFSVNGTRLFNVLPKKLRNLTNCPVSEFKANLDRFLKLIPDQPIVPGNTMSNQFHSNSSNE